MGVDVQPLGFWTHRAHGPVSRTVCRESSALCTHRAHAPKVDGVCSVRSGFRARRPDPATLPQPTWTFAGVAGDAQRTTGAAILTRGPPASTGVNVRRSRPLRTPQTAPPEARQQLSRQPCGAHNPPLIRADAGLLAIIICLCVVVVEVTVRSRPRRAVGSARSTRQSSIACARSSRMPPQPASVGAGPSVPRRAAVPAVMSRASRPPRIAIRAPRRVTSKRPRKRPPRSSGPPRKTSSNSDGHVMA
jgi:hypothetical protein